MIFSKLPHSASNPTFCHRSRETYCLLLCAPEFLNCLFTLAYVTHEDISHLQVLQEQTVMAVKAPEETKLEVPAPKEVKHRWAFRKWLHSNESSGFPSGELRLMSVARPEDLKWCISVFVFGQDSIQVHLKADKGPIMVMTCDVGVGQQSSCFLALEESGIKVAPLKKGERSYHFWGFFIVWKRKILHFFTNI